MPVQRKHRRHPSKLGKLMTKFDEETEELLKQDRTPPSCSVKMEATEYKEGEDQAMLKEDRAMLKEDRAMLNEDRATLREDRSNLKVPTGSPGSSKGSSPERSLGSASIDMTPSLLVPKPGTRTRKNTQPRYEPEDWDDSLPYGGKVYLARQKKPDAWWCIAIQVFLVVFAVGLVYYAWYHSEHMHFHTTKFYAHLGHMHAQAIIAEKYLNGKGVEKNHSEAMAWYKKAAEQGHPHSAYNVAVGHLKFGYDVGLQPGDAYQLIKHAADNGVPEAVHVFDKLCSKGACDL